MATGNRILRVEDEGLILQMLGDILRAQGYEVLTAQDGAEGLARARTEQPDLLILDIMMPRLDGGKGAPPPWSGPDSRRPPPPGPPGGGGGGAQGAPPCGRGPGPPATPPSSPGG